MKRRVVLMGIAAAVMIPKAAFAQGLTRQKVTLSTEGADALPAHLND